MLVRRNLNLLDKSILLGRKSLSISSFRNNNTDKSLSTEFSINKNACGIQQLSDELHCQIFPERSLPTPSKSLIQTSQKYLEDNDLFGKPCSINTPINFKLPIIHGKNINQHFQNLGLNSAEKYIELVENLLKIGLTPLPKPDEWIFKSGWTRYAPNEIPKSVPYPLEDELVFDCEVMYKQSPYSVMATCLSPLAWYSWCSPYLTGESDTNNHLIPLATDKKDSIIVGHNISFDRARILEEYNLKSNNSFFLDTMSLHVAVSGMCSRQRGTWMKFKKNINEKIKSQEKTLQDFRDLIQNEELRYTMSNMVLDEESADDNNEINDALNDDPWMKNSSMNKLSDVAEFHCGIKMNKQLRDHFATNDVNEIRNLFQSLMNYCADDVIATYHVLHKVYPMFRKVVPHPVSFAALKHINSSFLPTSNDWENYIHRCENMYQKSKLDVESKVHTICEEVVSLRKNSNDPKPPWIDNPWLSQLDWTIKPIKMTKAGIPYKNQKLPGFPEWYRKLIVKDNLSLTIKTRCCPLLLNILWENKPIFWTDNIGWCFIVDNNEIETFLEKKYIQINPSELLKIVKDSKKVIKFSKISSKKSIEKNDNEVKISKSKSKPKPKKIEFKEEEEENNFAESDPVVRANLEKLIKNNQTLFKIPHENGEDARVTSLITKPFLRYFEDGVLSSSHKLAKEAFQMNVMNSYWVSSRERIMNQFVVYQSTLDDNKKLNSNNSPDNNITTKEDKKELGFIIPQIIPMGTITRRAVEKTWLTASNAKKSRLGSELKSLIQAPPGYCFVGADVDSEELWIASLVGDSVFRLHGGTALGWMTLEGTKNAGTDLHSKTANILGISRNEAKVFNYGRIYGAGVKFATSLLKKFNPSITDEKASEVAKTLYAETKGNTGMIKVPYMNNEKVKLWYGGSESVVFNRLENIAEQDNPKTPVLGAGITAALKRTNLRSNSFLPSRINWAIQSSGVDYLHLLLVSMEHLCKIYNVDARLAITVHDEVRYMTKEENKYKCAMLLQIANLWTRAMFCFQLGIEDIPQSCAFFSCVDIDFVLRKEVDFDCITPSNPDPIPHGESIDIYQLLEKEEIQEMLLNLNEKLNTNKYFDINAKIYRPVEELDRKMDMSTKLNWINLQISKTEDEFKRKKKMFFSSIDHSKLEKFSKKLLKEDNKLDDVVCDGLFDSKNTDYPILDSGMVLDEIWDDENSSLVTKKITDKKLGTKSMGKTKIKTKKNLTKKSKTNSSLQSVNTVDENGKNRVRLETHTDYYVDLIANNVINSTFKEASNKLKTKINLKKDDKKKEDLKETFDSKLDDSSINTMVHSHHHSHLTANELNEIQSSY